MPFIEPPPLPAALAAELPGERRAFALESRLDLGRHLHFLDAGSRDGRPVLLQHGNPTWCYLWRKVMNELSDSGLRLIAPDLLGFGLSSRLPHLADHSVKRHAIALAALVAALDLRDTVLVGQDWGGPILAATAARSPERFTAVVLANTAVTVPPKPRGTAFHRFARMPILSDFAFRVLGFPQRFGLHRVQADRRSLAGQAARPYQWPLRHFRDRIAPLALARMVPSSQDHLSLPELRRGEAWLRAFQGPAALVWGLKDPILGHALRFHQEALPQAKVTTSNAAGHFLQEEIPEILAEAIRDTAQRLA
jgi:haloalkane dehalogenase